MRHYRYLNTECENNAEDEVSEYKRNMKSEKARKGKCENVKIGRGSVLGQCVRQR